MWENQCRICAIEVGACTNDVSTYIKYILGKVADYYVFYSGSRHGFTYIRGWMQMVLAPNDLFSWNNKAMSTMLLLIFTHFLLVGYAHYLTLCMLAFWSHEGVVFLPSSHLITSSRLPWLGSTDAHWPPTGGPGPFTSKMATLSTGSAHRPLPGSRTIVLLRYNTVVGT